MKSERPKRRFRILMACDFFYPQLGGVEMHIWSLSQHLLLRGHKVVVVTHAYGNRIGRYHNLDVDDSKKIISIDLGVSEVRTDDYLDQLNEVYYLPLKSFVSSSIFPTLLSTCPLIRQILIREKIDIVHGHQAPSALAQEAMMFARHMGYKVAYTDHSLYGFNDSVGIHLNKYMKFVYSHVDRAICVSHTCRENFCLRSDVPPENAYVIPNAVDCRKFTPDTSLRFPKDTINVVLISRLVQRKGVDLVAPVVSRAAALNPRLHFIIGGDGPKRIVLEEMREKYNLYERVEILGSVQHSEVRNVLCRGHIFLNCSLTDSFCIAILEAASCGLYVVATNVGGVPEVLPDDMVSLASPSVDELVNALLFASTKVDGIDPFKLHERVASMYSWEDICVRTEVVYDAIMNAEKVCFRKQIELFRCVGWFGQIMSSLAEALLFITLKVLEFFQPEDGIDIAPDWPDPNSLVLK